MVSAFSQFIEERGLCNPNHKILVAVSGGVDSIVMLDLFYKAGYNISIAHYNFKLRGQESDNDELFVRNLAKKYKVKVFTKSFDAEAYAKNNKLSVQEVARNLRYNWFEKLAIDKGFDRVAVGQHLDDQIETFFIWGDQNMTALSKNSVLREIKAVLQVINTRMAFRPQLD